MSYLKGIICDKIGSGAQCLLICNGEILDESSNLSQYPAVTDGAKIILQRRPIDVSFADRVNFNFYTPQVIVNKN